MSETIKFKRTSVLQKRPTAAQLDLGEPAVVLHQSSFGVFLEDANGDIRKVGPIHVGSSAPNGALLAAQVMLLEKDGLTLMTTL